MIVSIKNFILFSLLKIIKNIDFKWSDRLRLNILKSLGARIGCNVKIKSGFYIDNPKNLTIGDNVSIQHNCFFSSYKPIIIGDDVSIAHGVSFVTATHPYDTHGIIRNEELMGGGIIIGNNCWIGMKASILFDVEVSDGVVIGAHSLVNKSVPKNMVVAGVPARFLKNRI